MKNFDELLKKYADFIVRVGVNPQPGQVLIINCALEGAPLARLCVRSAFEAGARDVQVNWTTTPSPAPAWNWAAKRP